MSTKKFVYKQNYYYFVNKKVSLKKQGFRTYNIKEVGAYLEIYDSTDFYFGCMDYNL